MNDLLQESSFSTWTDVISSGGNLLLLGDMCFFASATLNAHLHYMQSWDTDCTQDLDKVSVRSWTTVGYSLRIIFTIVFFVSKVKNLYKFISRKHHFPRIGALYSPFMSTLLLSVIVYDFQSCQQLSDIFSISSAKKLISWYSILVIVILSAFFAMFLISFTTKKTHSNKIFTLLKIVFGIIILIGCFIGIIANIEMMNKNKINLFSAFDVYSFLIGGVVMAFSFVIKLKNRNRSPVSSI